MNRPEESGFVIKDSGKRQEFPSGMVRDTTDGKVNYLAVFDGPMVDRWAVHLTKGKIKYPDVAPGVANWTLAKGEEELQRAKESLARHYRQYVRGDRDEDHAAGIYFNINLIEYIREKTKECPF